MSGLVALRSAAREPFLELTGHAEQHVARCARGSAAAAARRECDAETGSEDRDRDVVQARPAPLDLLCEAALEVGRHAYEHVAAKLGHAKSDSTDALSKALA